MSFDLLLKPRCTCCGSTTDLYGSNCKHMTLCLTCGKKFAENRDACFHCGATLTRLIREYNLRLSSINDKKYFIGRFAAGLPDFSENNKWTLQKEVTDTPRDKFKDKPWLLKDEVSQSEYHGQPEGSQSASYHLLMLQGKEFVAIPAGSWYKFNKVARCKKQLSLEEAEEKMNNRRRNVKGREMEMMKNANSGPSLFGESEKILEKEVGIGSGGDRGRKKPAEDEGEEDEQAARKSRCGLNKKGVDDDDGEGRSGGDFDDGDDDIEKGDDWEHEDIFTDDDEAVGNGSDEREDLAPEVPAPPEIKQDEEDEEDGANEKDGGLSKSGKELKKLLGRMNDSDEEEDDDDSDHVEEEDHTSPVSALKAKDAPKEEPSDNGHEKTAVKVKTPSTSKSVNNKRKINGDDTKAASTDLKKVKTENEQTPPAAAKSRSSLSQGSVTEGEIRAILMQRSPMTSQDLVSIFKPRLRSQEDKKAFTEILKRISIILKASGQSRIVLRDR